MAAKKRTVTQSRGSGRGLVSPAKVKYLVGVGASAGGLDALRPLIGHLRERGVAAYIVAQHMSPTYVSVLAELLGKHSQIPVISASDGDVLVPDRVYIIPPNHDALVKEGRLELVVPESETHACPSVDILFRSIAESHGAMAVGVVLSGTGSDGLAGAEAIKAAGGTVIAQKLDEAGKESMPFSVLRAGLADQELGAEEIASYLNSLGEQSGVTHGAPEIHPEIPTFRNLLDMVFKATQMDVSLYKEATLMRQVEKRLSTLGLSTIADYITYVQSHPDELTVLQHSFLISVTSFFRDQGAFRALERALRGLVANKKPGDSIRAWVPGCATGEEAYTIAILLKEAVGNRSGELDVRVFATDIDMAAMEFAREAIYPPSALEHIEPARRERYFTREGSSYKISKEIRELCVFSIHDVVRHPPFMHMDIISCRNLLIYFKPALQEQLFVGFHYALNYDGYLLLGKSESIGVASKLFEAEDARNKLFRRKPVTISYPARTDSRSLFIPFSRQAAVQSQSNTKTLADLTCEVLMSEYAPPSILVSMSFDVLHFFGNAKRYLDFPKGHADFSLFSICLPELRGELKTLCYRITQEGMSHIVGLPTEIPIDGQPVLVRLALRRVFINKENTEHALLISFEEHGRRRTDEVPVNTASPDISELAAHEIQRLRQELADTREHLQTVIEELEASNEELQSLNEELQSSSEELQASNEELQSSNEELTTLNDELRSKSSELVDLNTTLTNIQDSIHMGLVVIDKEARIARFNELAVRVFGLMQGDIGKYLYGVPCHLEMPALREQITSVIGTGVPIIERARHGDYHYLMQIAPYMNESGLRTGAVLTFTDVSELQRAEEALRQSEETYRNLFKNMLNGLAYCRMQFKNGVPDDFTYLSVNDAFEKLTGLTKVVGKNVTEVIPGIKEADPKFFDLFGRVAMTGQPERCELYIEALQMWFWISVYSPEKEHFVAVFEVITERKRAEEKLQVALTKYKTLFESLPLGITVADKSGRILESNLMAEKLLGLSPEEQKQRQIDGQEWRIVRPDSSTMPPEEYASVRALEENRLVENVEMGLVKPSGQTTWISVTAAPLSLKDYGLVIAYTDVTERKLSQDQLRRSDARFHLAQKAANAGTWEWDLRTNENIWSEEVWPLYGLDRQIENASYDVWCKAIHPDDREKTQKAVQDAVRRVTELNLEWRVLDSDGRERWIMSRGQPLTDIAGRPERFVGIVMDITERKQAEIALAEESIRRRVLFEQATDGIVVLDHNRKVIEANQHFADMLGYTLEEINQLHAWDWDTIYSTQEKMLSEWPELPTTSNTIETQHRRKDGSVYEVEISWNPAEWGGQRQLYCVCRDITARKQAEMALRESEEKLRLFIEHAPVSLAMFDRNMCYISASRRWLTDFCLDDRDVIGRSHYDIFPEINESLKEVHRRGMFGEIVRGDNDRFDREDGSMHWLRWEMRPWHTASGEIGGIVVITRDITERKRALVALTESEERFRLLFENMTNGFALHEIICNEHGTPVDYRFLKINPAFEKLTGLSATDLLGKTVREVMPDIEDFWIEQYGKVALTGEPVSFESYTKPIDKYFQIISFCPQPNQFAVIFEDITKRKRAEQALMESEARLLSILRTAPVGIGLVVNRVIMDVNEMIASMTGYSREELVGASARIFYPTDEEFDRVGTEKYAQIKQSGFGTLEARWQHKNGSILHIILSSSSVDPIDLSRGVTFSAQDITERKRAELALKESEERFRLTFYTSPDSIAINRQKDEVFVDVNDSFCLMTGYTREEVLGKTARQISIWYNPAERRELVDRLRENGYCENMEVRLRLKDGTVGIGLMSARIIFLQGVPHMISMTRDITERKRIEEALRLSEEKYRVLSENATDIVWMLDFNTERFTYFSPSIQTMRGYTPDEAMAIPLDQTLLPESYQRAKAVLKESLERESKRGTPGVVRLMVLQEHCKDGSIIDTEAKVKFTRDLYGHPTGIIGTTRDITKRKRVERRLQESEARYRLISENTGDVIWMYDLEASRYTYVSPSVERLRGYTPQEVLTQTMSESLTPDSMNVVSGLLPARILALESGNESVRTTTHEVDQPRRDGSIVPTEVVTTLVQNEAGKVVRIIGVTRDITERKRAQEALQIALTKYKMLFELFPLGIVVADESGLILESNLMAGKLLNLSPEHNLRLRINEINLKIVRPDGQPMRPQEYACVRALREKRRVENVVMEVHDHPSGQIKWISATATPLSLKGYGVVVAFSDITEIKQAEQALKESEERFRMTFYTSPDAISISRIDDGLYIEINDGFSKLVGYSREEVIGRTSIELSIWTSAEDRAELVRGLKERGFYENMETSFRRKDGSILTGLMSAKTITFDGKPHLIAIVRDITERNLAAQALKESEERFRLTFYTSPDAVNINRLDSGVYVDINDGFTQITGYTKEDVMGKTSLSLNLWCNLEDQQKMIRDFTETGHCENLEARFLRKDGTIIIGLLSARVISFHGVPHLICITRDITGRYTAEQQLRKLSMAVEQSPTIIVITDADGAIQYVNASFETITGYSRDEVVGQNPRILKSGQHDNDFYRSLWKTISAGKVWEGRLINRRKDGSLYTEEVTISPLRDASGRVVNYVAVKRDITEHLRLHEEREKLREQLLQAQKMESVGRLAGGVAHDFNNMLQAILGYIDIMLSDIQTNELQHERLVEIRRAAQRSADLVRQLLAFARKQTVMPKVLVLNEIVYGMLKMLKPLIGEDIALEWLPGDDLWSVKIDPSQIDQLLTNLVINARDAINGVGKISIETKNEVFDEAYCAAHPDSVPGEYVLLVVSDNGRGIDKDTQAHIFEPFFTTKSIGEGTGLGLATVYGIVKQNGGLIDVESELGKGAIFRIHLPKWTAEAGDAEHAPAVKTIQKGTETLLLVEDEESILNICKAVLEQLGYTVLAANAPSEAIRIANEFKSKIHLLITDVIMPEMNGRELAQRLFEILPDLKCLYMSGYTADIIASRGVPDEQVRFLQKPFYMKDLAAKIREALDEQ